MGDPYYEPTIMVHDSTFVIKRIPEQWVKNANFRKKFMQVFIALLVGELTLQ